MLQYLDIAVERDGGEFNLKIKVRSSHQNVCFIFKDVSLVSGFTWTFVECFSSVEKQKVETEWFSYKNLMTSCSCITKICENLIQHSMFGWVV